MFESRRFQKNLDSGFFLTLRTYFILGPERMSQVRRYTKRLHSDRKLAYSIFCYIGKKILLKINPPEHVILEMKKISTIKLQESMKKHKFLWEIKQPTQN